MKITKFLFFLLALLPCGLCAQSPIVARIQIETQNNACAKDTVAKTLVLEKETNGAYQKIYAFQYGQCVLETKLPKMVGNFRLKISAFDYKEQTVLFSIKNTTTELDLGKVILLRKNSDSLPDVLVSTVRKDWIKIDGDKTTYLVRDNAALSTGMIADAIKKIPGIMLGPDGNLVSNGKPITVYVDGVPSMLSGDDLNSFLESMPANSIEKIEVISNPGASYEANASGKILNIITSSATKKQLNGILNLNYGKNNYNKLSPSLFLNGRIKKISWQLQTGYNYQESETNINTTNYFLSFTPEVVFAQNTQRKPIQRNFFVRPMFSYQINKKSNFFLNYNFSFSNQDNYSTNNSSTQNYTPAIQITNQISAPTKNNDQEWVARYVNNWDTSGKKITLTAYYTTNSNKALNQSIQNKGGFLYSLMDNKVDLNNFYVKYDLELPMNKLKLTLNTGGKYNYFSANSFGKYNLNNPTNILLAAPQYNDSLLFKYFENTLSLYIEAKKTFGKLSVTAGARLENLKYESRVVQQSINLKNNYTNVFPNVNFNYQFNQIVQFNASYTQKISMPPYSELNPNKNGYFGLYNSTAGNPFLQPSFYHNFAFKISAMEWLQLGFDHSYTKNISLMSFDAAPNSLFTIQTYNKYAKSTFSSVYASIPIPFGLITKGKAFFKQAMDYDKMSGLLAYISYNKHDVKDFAYTQSPKPFWTFMLYSQIILPLDFKFGLSYFCMTKGNFQIYQINKPIQVVNASLTKKVIKNKLEATLQANDIFGPTILNGIIPSNNLKVDYQRIFDSKVVWIKLSFKFGSHKSVADTEIKAEKKETESKEGINRIGN